MAQRLLANQVVGFGRGFDSLPASGRFFFYSKERTPETAAHDENVTALTGLQSRKKRECRSTWDQLKIRERMWEL